MQWSVFLTFFYSVHNPILCISRDLHPNHHSGHGNIRKYKAASTHWVDTIRYAYRMGISWPGCPGVHRLHDLHVNEHTFGTYNRGIQRMKSWPTRVSPGLWFNVKVASHPYRESHCGDKTVVRSSYLHNGSSYTYKMTSLHESAPIANIPVLPWD